MKKASGWEIESVTDKLREYFWERVAIPFDTTDEDCWLWCGCIETPGSYGVAVFGGYRLRSHQLSFVINRGPLIRGMDIAHTCDNRPCVNPGHLRQWTRKQNMEDAASKGIMAHGESHYKSRLSNVQVAEVLTLSNLGMTGRTIAMKFGVSTANISNILNGRSRA